MLSTRDLNMLEDGLSLWITMLRFVPYSPTIGKLFPAIPTALEFAGSEEYMLRRQFLRVIEA